MSKVYFTPMIADNMQHISNTAKSLLNKVIKDHSISLQPFTPIKVHFGEPENTTFVPAAAYDGIIEYLHSLGIETAYIETNVLYGGMRQRKSTHLQVAKNHGFTQIPIIIADGEIGENYIEVEINGKYFQKAKIGAEFQHYDQMIVCSHFKGHMVSSFGGALKQLAMGCAARGGKMDQHSKMCPVVKQKHCTACGLCIKKCGVNAITMQSVAAMSPSSQKAFIDKDLCIGCAGCIATCPQKAITHDWGGENFNLKLAEYALAASLNKQNIYINFVISITKDCDCMGHKMTPIASDIGILASLDPVAIDTASLDLLQKSSNSDLFEGGRNTLEYAEKLGIGTRDYTLQEL